MLVIVSEVIGKNIGKMVASSKKMIKWGLIINLKKVEIMLKHSTVSGKRLIRVNEVVVHESRGVGHAFWVMIFSCCLLPFLPPSLLITISWK